MKNIYHVRHMEELVELKWKPSSYILTVSATLALYNIRPNDHGLNVIALNPLFRQVANDPRFEQIVAQDSGDMAYKYRNIYVYGRIHPQVINNDELISLGEIHSNVNFIPLEVIRDRLDGMFDEVQGYINRARMNEAKEHYNKVIYELKR